MTFYEKLKQDFPDLNEDELWNLMIYNCPEDFGYELSSPKCNESSCCVTRCWRREYVPCY